jgi:hypothetical protein
MSEQAPELTSSEVSEQNSQRYRGNRNSAANGERADEFALEAARHMSELYDQYGDAVTAEQNIYKDMNPDPETIATAKKEAKEAKDAFYDEKEYAEKQAGAAYFEKARYEKSVAQDKAFTQEHIEALQEEAVADAESAGVRLNFSPEGNPAEQKDKAA